MTRDQQHDIRNGVIAIYHSALRLEKHGGLSGDHLFHVKAIKGQCCRIGKSIGMSGVLVPADKGRKPMFYPPRGIAARRQQNLTTLIAFAVLLAVGILSVLALSGCSLKSIVSSDPPTAADCATIRAYIDMCNTELVKASLPGKTRQWWDLALAGAQVELARKCAGAP